MVCTVAGSTATIVKAGDCVVRADQSGTSNYVAATTQQTIAINRAAQTISFPTVAPIPTFVAGGAGTFQVEGLTFVVLLIGTVLLVGALTFLPALAMGPVAEHFLMGAGELF